MPAVGPSKNVARFPSNALAATLPLLLYEPVVPMTVPASGVGVAGGVGEVGAAAAVPKNCTSATSP